MGKRATDWREWREKYGGIVSGGGGYRQSNSHSFFVADWPGAILAKVIQLRRYYECPLASGGEIGSANRIGEFYRLVRLGRCYNDRTWKDEG